MITELLVMCMPEAQAAHLQTSCGVDPQRWPAMGLDGFDRSFGFDSQSLITSTHTPDVNDTNPRCSHAGQQPEAHAHSCEQGLVLLNSKGSIQRTPKAHLRSLWVHCQVLIGSLSSIHTCLCAFDRQCESIHNNKGVIYYLPLQHTHNLHGLLGYVCVKTLHRFATNTPDTSMFLL